MKNSLFAVMFCFAASCASMPVSPQVAKSAATIGCIALQASGCFDDVQNAFPGLNAGTCSQVVGAAIDVAYEVQKNFQQLPKEQAAIKSAETIIPVMDKVNIQNWDPLKVDPEKLSPNSSCRKAARNLGVK